MSCDFYFKKWKITLRYLENIIQTDLQYQIEKTHDQLFPNAVHRLTSVLCQYMICYNNVIECLNNNLQVQKTVYIEKIYRAIVSRILELKHELLKLESSHYQFLSTALVENFHTSYDAEMTKLSNISYKRSPPIQDVVEKTLKTVNEKERGTYKDEDVEADAMDNISEKISISKTDGHANENNEIIVQDNKTSNEIVLKRYWATLIIAHEKLRQNYIAIKVSKQRRQRWIKELDGTAKPPARYELRLKSAQLIQRVVRTYFDIKRKRIRDCRVEQLLGMSLCTITTSENSNTISKVQKFPDRLKMYDAIVQNLISEKEILKKEYIRRHGDEIIEDYRDRVREWFYEWFLSIQVIPEIPQPGTIAIFRGEVPDPHEWLEEYKEAMIQKKANKGKEQKKFEAQRAKKEEQMAMREKLRKQREEQAFMRKFMKNPELHPGYHYPQSKIMDHFLEVIGNYHREWDFYDTQDIAEAKYKYINEVNVNDVYSGVKLEMLQHIEEDLKVEQRKLKKSLRKDYENNEEIMPELPKKRKKKKKEKKLKPASIKEFEKKLEDLAQRGFVLNYPKTKLEDCVGDPNFAGEDLRRFLLPVYRKNYEIRNFWWESCYAASHGFWSVLLVGADGSGKQKLVHALASTNDAVLLEIDPLKLTPNLCTPTNLKMLCKNILLCASVAQPSVIYIRHIQKLFLTKITIETDLNSKFIRSYFLKPLFKKIKKRDRIAVIGSCSDPWLTKSKVMLKYFPTILLLPDNTYSNIVQMLEEWVSKYTVIPSTFDVSCLGQVLQGYSYGYLQEALTSFMSAERRVKIAAFGITPLEVYEYILDDKDGIKVEYDRYLSWYWQKTSIGVKEKKHMGTQLEFREAVERFQMMKAKKERQAKRSAAASAVSSRSNIP